MAPKEGDSGEEDHNTLEDNERNLVLDHLTVITLAELSNTVDTSSENEEDRHAETDEEGLHAPAEVGGEPGAKVAEHVVGEGDDEEHEDDDLKGQTSHRDVDTGLRVVHDGGHGTAGGLEDQADDVEGEEDPVEELGLEAGEFRGEVDDGLGEGDVDGSGEEDGSDGQADYIVLVSLLCELQECCAYRSG